MSKTINHLHCFLSSLVLGVELVVKFSHSLHGFLHLFGWTDQVSQPQVVSAFSLAKTAAWHCHNASLFKQIHAVHEVWHHLKTFRSIKGFLCEVDLRETVHGSVNVIASDVVHVTQSVLQNVSPLCQASEDFVSLFSVESDSVL